MNELLEQQANAIEDFLARHGIAARVEGGALSPRLISFNMTLGSEARPARVAALAEKLATFLGVGCCRLAKHGAAIAIEVPRSDPTNVRLLPLYQQLNKENEGEGNGIPAITALLGLDYEGTPLLLRLASPEVENVLIGGETGSGKTALMAGMIGSLALANAPDELQLLLIDVGRKRGKGGGVWADWTGLPHLIAPPVTDPLDAANRLAWLSRQMEWRADERISSPAIVVFIDEIGELLAGVEESRARLLRRLLQRGRQGAIYFVIGASHTDALGELLTESNIPARIVGRMSEAAGEALTQVRGSGTDKLLGRGDFLISLRGELTRMQSAIINQGEIHQLVSLMRRIAEEREAEAETERAPAKGTQRGPLTSVPATAAPLTPPRNWQQGGDSTATPMPAPRKGLLDTFRRRLANARAQ
jgi:DNA segregation ATPase FtsK/SpoIIIE, S-DNA-T family